MKNILFFCNQGLSNCFQSSSIEGWCFVSAPTQMEGCGNRNALTDIFSLELEGGNKTSLVERHCWYSFEFEHIMNCSRVGLLKTSIPLSSGEWCGSTW